MDTNKGFNTLVTEIKADLGKKVEEALKLGMPISVVNLMLESIVLEVKLGLNTVLAKEQEEYMARVNTSQEEHFEE